MGDVPVCRDVVVAVGEPANVAGVADHHHAATTGPTPKSSVSVVPDSLTRARRLFEARI